MKTKISIAIFVLLSFLNIGALSNNSGKINNSFSTLEINAANISNFEENGIKLQYKTQENMEKESTRIKEYLTHSINGSYKELGDNEFEVLNKDIDVNVKIWCEDKYNYAEIILFNKDPKYSTKDLKNILQGLENYNTQNIQYFLYYEGKGLELDKNYSLDKFVSENNIQKAKLLGINNGYIGTGYLSGGDKINFALIKYNTGSHIIIGTPIIFATY